MKMHIRMLVLTAAIGFAVPAFAGEKIKIGSSNWPSIQAMSSVLKVISEKYFGDNAEVVNSTLPIILSSMDQGDVDILAEIGSPNHDSFIKTYVKDKKTVKLGHITYQMLTGLCTTKHTQQTLGLTSIYDLSKPEIADQFKTADGGKPKLWIGPTGWSSSKVEIIRARDYGYADLFDLSTVEEPLAIVDLEQAIRSNKPWVGICYTPHPTFSGPDIVMLEEPAHDDTKWKVVQPDENVNWLQMSSVQTAWKPTSQYIAYSSKLEQKDPKLAALIDHMQFGPTEIADWIQAVGVEKKDPDEVAKAWVAKNDAKILGWMAAKP